MEEAGAVMWKHLGKSFRFRTEERADLCSRITRCLWFNFMVELLTVLGKR